MKNRRVRQFRTDTTQLGIYMELMNLGLQALQHVVHAGDAIGSQLNYVLDSMQVAQPGDEAPITCTIYRCNF